MFLIARIAVVATLVLFAVPMLYWIWSGAPWVFSVGVLVLFVLHAAAYRALAAGEQWGMWVWLVGLTACLVLAAPNVIYNFYLFFTDHPLYLDSPGTILVVATTAFFLVVPQALSLLLLVGAAASKRLPWQATNNALQATCEDARA